MNLIINDNLTVSLEAASQFFDIKKAFAQWKSMIKDVDGNWVLDPNDTTSLTCLVAEKDAYDAFMLLSDSDKQAAYANAIQNQYLS